MMHRSLAVVVLTTLVWWAASGTPGATDESWVHVVALTDPTPADDAAPGRSVAIDGDVIVAGANGGESHAEAAHVFTGDPSSGDWTHDQELVDATAIGADLFGTAVDVDGNRVVVGDPSADGNRRALHLFVRNSSTSEWEVGDKPTDPDGIAGDGLGLAVDIDGEARIRSEGIGSRDDGAQEVNDRITHDRCPFALQPDDSSPNGILRVEGGRRAPSLLCPSEWLTPER